jgi:glycosyltransferase involved in cell wall biosynthesis
MPKISVITPTYNTPKDVLARTWASLKAQSFTDWEWVVYDDSTNPEVARQLYGYQSDERYKLTVWSGLLHSGSIGQVKRVAFMSAQGDYLVELDHDDELTPDALQEIVDVMEQGADFCFSDWAEVFSDGTSGRYPEGWGLGFGVDSWNEEHNLWQLSMPTMTSESMRHIVGVPNHVRAWNAKFYRSIGGHDATLEVCDDYDLIIRTFLNGDFQHIPKLLYKQHIGSHTAQRKQNARIQELVPVIYAKYAHLL